jgi:hypothetical protein
MTFTFNRGRFAVDMYEFTLGGDGDVLMCDFVNDARQGFHVPAKSLSIQNHGGGSGWNYIYYKTTHDGRVWSKTTRLLPDAFKNYMLGETVFYACLIWSSNSNCMVSVDATPGDWDEKEAKPYISDPMIKKSIEAIVASSSGGVSSIDTDMEI